MKLYHLLTFDRSLKVRWLANELDVAFEQITLDISKMAHLTPPFSDMNPYGLIPTIEKDNGQVLFEAAAICLDMCRSKGKSLINEEDIEFMQWLFFFASSLDALSGAIVSLKVFGENQGVRTLAERRLPPRLAAMEKHLAGQSYWYKNQFSLLDIFAWQNLAFLYVDGQLHNYPNLAAYVEKMANRPALAQLNPNGLLYGNNG
ncbi:glutathione S-transferase family protein [Catenovulum sp. 2E275]|uniref:glutathione S-transferase family protein n=1 Tax=Catenovulum sp. 2E275 TaxID=2980497 RepID=UPI0021CFE9D2|nr:glutathione S-transferase family protein [Catenovulum sp. 2E275]MCU4676642.1 glutathione S-transferase family protein [Catenovulum sp. 2E275]